MQTQGTESAEKQPSTLMDTAMGVAMIPVLFVGACLAVPYTLGRAMAAACMANINCGC